MARTPMFDKDEKPASSRTVNDTRKEKEANVGHVRNLGKGPTNLTVVWDFNERAADEGVCIIKIGDQEATVSVEQLNRFLRWV